MEQTTPLDVATGLEGAAAETFAALAAIRESAKQDTELQKTVNDCEAIAWLGRYYAAKIRGACALAFFDANGDKFEQDAALRHLDGALTHWKRYAVIRDAHYLPALYNRLAPSARAAVVQISLLGFAASADFEVTVAGWLQQHSGNALPTLPEVRRIAPQLLQCFYGEDDDVSACTRIGTDIELIRTTGSHHFDGNYPALARRIMQGLQQRKLP